MKRTKRKRPKAGPKSIEDWKEFDGQCVNGPRLARGAYLVRLCGFNFYPPEGTVALAKAKRISPWVPWAAVVEVIDHPAMIGRRHLLPFGQLSAVDPSDPDLVDCFLHQRENPGLEDGWCLCAPFMSLLRVCCRCHLETLMFEGVLNHPSGVPVSAAIKLMLKRPEMCSVLTVPFGVGVGKKGVDYDVIDPGPFKTHLRPNPKTYSIIEDNEIENGSRHAIWEVNPSFAWEDRNLAWCLGRTEPESPYEHS